MRNVANRWAGGAALFTVFLLIAVPRTVARGAGSQTSLDADPGFQELVRQMLTGDDLPDAREMRPTDGEMTWTLKIDHQGTNGSTYNVLEKVSVFQQGKKNGITYQATGDIVFVSPHSFNNGTCPHTIHIPLGYHRTLDRFPGFPILIVSKKRHAGRFQITPPSPFPALGSVVQETGTCDSRWAPPRHDNWIMETAPVPNAGGGSTAASAHIEQLKKRIEGRIGYIEGGYANRVATGSAVWQGTVGVGSPTVSETAPATITISWKLSEAPPPPQKKRAAR